MKFYTYYPYPHREYPYVLRNINQKEIPYKHQIVDIGIYDLLKKGEHSDKKITKWKALYFKDDSWKVVPDFPDMNKEFKGKYLKDDNIELSKQMILELYNPDNKSHLISIQGHYADISSFEKFAKWIKKEYGDIDKLAVGTVCKLSDKFVAIQTFKIVRNIFPKSHIHAFGLRLDYVRPAHRYIDSFDSMSWTFPRGRGRGSCKNLQERIEFFDEYVERIPKLTRNKTLLMDLI